MGQPYPPSPSPAPDRPEETSGWSPGPFLPAVFVVAALVILLLVGAAIVSRRSVSTPAVTAALAGPSVTVTATARVYVVANTGGVGVYLRRTPRLDDRDTAYPDETRLVAVGDDVTADGLTWHHVRAPDGRVGWVPAMYTVAGQ